MTLIVTRPQYDDTTTYISAWAEEVIFAAKQREIEVIDLHQAQANRVNFEQAIGENAPRLVFLNGHGEADRVLGQEHKVLLKAGENHNLLAGKITYALSCNAGQTLGPMVAGAEDAVFIGYSDKFIFLHRKNRVKNIQNDPVARPFMKASNKVMISLLEGCQAQDAVGQSQDCFLEEYNNYLSSEADPVSGEIAQYLWWNMSKQVCLGDGNAQLSLV